jgi:2,3-dihydroxyphenylpropionate 1,2-dioxygenase
MTRADVSELSRLTVCVGHADPLDEPGEPAFAYGSPVLHGAWNQARSAIAAFDPELVVLFGPDHRRAFRSVIPTVAVALSATGRGDRDGPTGAYRVPSELARELAQGLLQRHIDAAVAYRPVLDHGLGLTARDLLGGLDARPVIPVVLNCASPPVVSLARAAEIGQAVGDSLADRPERILFVGSAGLTHDLPGFYPLDDGVDYSEEELGPLFARLREELAVPGRVFDGTWDREFLAGLSRSDRSWLESVGHDIAGRAGNGACESAAWVAAWAAGGEPLETLAYEFYEGFRAGTAVAVSGPAVQLVELAAAQWVPVADA